MDNEVNLILKLASSSASLATAPGNSDNWVERAGAGGQGGELPAYVRKLARGIMKSGKSKSQAIAIAISRIKRWALGGDDVKADTRAKAIKALAEWETLKMKNKINKVVGLSSPDGSGEYFALSHTDFNVNIVDQAWASMRHATLDAYYRGQDSPEAVGPDEELFPYIREVWNTFVIAEVRREAQPPMLLKIPYYVKGTEVHFGSPVEVKASFEQVEEELTDNEEFLLSDIGASVSKGD